MLPPSRTIRRALPLTLSVGCHIGMPRHSAIFVETGASSFQSLYFAQALKRQAVAPTTLKSPDLRESRRTKIGPESRIQARFVRMGKNRIAAAGFPGSPAFSGRT